MNRRARLYQEQQNEDISMVSKHFISILNRFNYVLKHTYIYINT